MTIYMGEVGPNPRRIFANAETPHFVLAKALIEDGWHKGDPA